MPISLKCPHCKEMIQVEKRLAGQFSTCSGCGEPIEIPTLEWLRGESAKKRESAKKPEPQTPALPPAVSAHPQRPPDPPVSKQEMLLESIDKLLKKSGEDLAEIKGNVGCFFIFLVVFLILSAIGFILSLGT